MNRTENGVETITVTLRLWRSRQHTVRFNSELIRTTVNRIQPTGRPRLALSIGRHKVSLRQRRAWLLLFLSDSTPVFRLKTVRVVKKITHEEFNAHRIVRLYNAHTAGMKYKLTQEEFTAWLDNVKHGI